MWNTTVTTGTNTYKAVVGEGTVVHLDDLVPWPRHARRAVVVTQEPIPVTYRLTVLAALRRAGLEPHVVVVDDGETAKTPEMLHRLWDHFAEIPVGRDDVVVALGGGVVGDLAGFLAATWNRGVALVHIPTTLLAMVDSSIGGKTGVNLAAGKNLVGAFHPPIAVVADVSTLATLDPRELRSGLGEVIKYGFIADPEILTLLPETLGTNRSVKAGYRPAFLLELIQRSVAVKTDVVTADERETGRRAVLNYGHTVGHAIEAATSFDAFRHGEAVGLGMIVAAHIAERIGVAERGIADRTVELLALVGLPTSGVTADPETLWAMMQRDKKARDGVRFVLCKRLGEADVYDQPDPKLITECLTAIA